MSHHMNRSSTSKPVSNYSNPSEVLTAVGRHEDGWRPRDCIKQAEESSAHSGLPRDPGGKRGALEAGLGEAGAATQPPCSTCQVLQGGCVAARFARQNIAGTFRDPLGGHLDVPKHARATRVAAAGRFEIISVDNDAARGRDDRPRRAIFLCFQISSLRERRDRSLALYSYCLLVSCSYSDFYAYSASLFFGRHKD